ncbi:sulfatase [Rubritalea spongiae]|uniref:Sulfatase n=1 Tax=Rubritalea spongiae TaxID=430797 RepID=A0ABW5E5B5_9BACT
MMRRILGVLCGLGLSLQAAPRPNIIVILTDDQGYGDLGCNGGGKHKVVTPHIDQMAKEGARLTNFYVAAAICTPSRAALMTGCYPKRIDMSDGVNLACDEKGLNPSEITIAELAQLNGYKTGMFGKWHLGDQPEFLPMNQGFEEFFGLPYSHDIHPFHGNQKKYNFPPLPLLEGEKVIELEPDADYLTKRITERAVGFIEKHKEEPFFMYVAHPLPHRPIHASPPFMEDLPETIQKGLKEENGTINYKLRDNLYSRAIAEVDWSVGQILEALEKQGIDENTFVLFTSDNGPKLGSSGKLTGGKGSILEGGMRVPTVVRWPQGIPAGKDNDEVMTAMDIFPTMASLMGGEVPQDRVIDGKDVSETLTAGASSPHEFFFYYDKNKMGGVRWMHWKLRMSKGKPVLVDLNMDVAEKQNVAKNHPEIVEQLKTAMQEFDRQITSEIRPAGYVENPQILTLDQ